MSGTHQPARANRVILAVTGIILLAGGAFALLTGLSVLTVVDPASPLVTQPDGPQSPWIPIAAVAVAVIIGLACLRWLVAQVPHRPKIGKLRLTASDSRTGHTSIDTDIAVGPLEHELCALPGVRAATADLTGTAGHPAIHLRVDAAPGTDLREVRHQIEHHVLPRLSRTLAVPTLPGTVRFRLTTSPRHAEPRVDVERHRRGLGHRPDGAAEQAPAEPVDVAANRAEQRPT